MPTLLHHPESPFPAAELDRFLTEGWRPTGQSIYTADYLRTDTDAVYGCLQLRIPLKGFGFKKRHRKLLRRNNGFFRTEIRQAGVPDEEMLEVNKRYLTAQPDKSQDNLAFHVIGDREEKVLDTWESRVYVKDQLIAFSYFDVGEHCLYAKAGIYDPAFSDYSLGTYTMLLELEWGIQSGYRYYHPGYYSPDYPAFDYKLSYGPTEYRDPAAGTWQLMEGDSTNHPADPYRRCEARLEEVVTAFENIGVGARLLEYPSFTARYFYANTNLEQEDLLDGALLVAPYGQLVPEELVVIYDLPSGQFICFETAWAGMQDFKLKPFSPANGRQRYGQPVAIHRLIATAKTAPELVAALMTVQTT